VQAQAVTVDDTLATTDAVVLPSLRQVARRALPQVVDGALLPLGCFFVVNQIAGVGMAMIAGLGWSGIAITRRVVRKRRVPAIAVLAAAMLVMRTILTIATGSAFLYFLQPTVGTAVVGLAFLFSVPLRKPLSRRFAGDFVTLPHGLLRDLRVHQFFVRNTMMWAIVGLLNATVAYLLLVSLATMTFAIVQTAYSISVTVLAVGISILWFRKFMGRYHPITVGT
jgi:intracellular septation protein A